VHSEQGMISNSRRREIAARVMVDCISTHEHPVSFQIFCAQPAQARLLLQFVPGLGPRKARRLAGQLCDNLRFVTREDLKCQIDSVPIIGDVTFMNCAGFLSGFVFLFYSTVCTSSAVS
jgi:transcriptional accessory protein Tex/SPT6